MTNQNNAAQAAHPQTVLSFDERERILCQFIGEPINHDREMAIAIESAVLSKLRAPVAVERLSDIERTAITGLIAVARAAFNVADDAEDDGDCVKVDRTNASTLGDALDALDELPDDQPGYSMGPSNKAEWALRRVLGLASAPVAGEAQHPDDAAVDRFAAAMKAKLAKKRAEGRYGWQCTSHITLSALLYEHVYKGDPLDVGNLAMMLHQNGMPIELPEHARRKDAAPQASAEAFDFVAHLARQAEFSARTFGPGARVAGVCDHIRKELIEVETSGGDLKEWVDVIILGLDGAWRSGATPREIIAAIVAKQAKNEARTWPDWRTVDLTKAIEHDRGGQP